MPLYRYYPNNNSADDRELEKKIFRHSLMFPAFFIILFWMVKLVEFIMGYSFVQGGVYPLHLKGLTGILTSPFIHSGFAHLVSNSVPFFILLFVLVYFYRGLSYRIFLQLYLFSGLCVWLFGREAWHIGASGVVYGMASFHLVSGIIRNDVRLLTISVVVVFLYGGMIWGMFPINPDISWESHLWGAVSGVLLAIAYRKYNIRRNPFEWENEPEEEDEPDPVQPAETDPTDQAESGRAEELRTAGSLQQTTSGPLFQPEFTSTQTNPSVLQGNSGNKEVNNKPDNIPG
jgi:membrane associated rhomboid family serine protease